MISQPGEIVLGDANRLQELFGNPFRNAIDHGETDVTVSGDRFDGGFFVVDDGPGISEED